MKWEEMRKKCSEVLHKVGMKTIVTVCTVVVLGAMVILNVILFSDTEPDQDGLKLAVDLSSETSEKPENNADLTGLSINDYFQTMALNRQQTRDEAKEVLLSVAESPTALEDAREAALQDISRLAADMEKENNIETMILSKGFTQCIAMISEDNCSVIVESDGLAPGEVAQITEIVYEQAGIHPTRLKIVEKSLTEA